MNRLTKELLSWLVAVAIVVGVSFAQQRITNRVPRILTRVSQFRSPRRVAENDQVNSDDLTDMLIEKKYDNPYLEVTERPQQIPFPFVEWLGTNFPGPTISYLESQKDKFQFRNRHRWIYDTPPKDDSLVIVFLSNSEGVGLYHPEPIAYIIEDMLREKGHDAIVINYAVNGHSLAHSWNTYFFFCHEYKVDYVVGHWGAMAHTYVRYSAPACVRMGLLHDPVDIGQAAILSRENATFDYSRSREIYRNEPAIGIRPYLNICERFKRYVEADGGQLVVGMQKMDADIGPWNEEFSGWEETYRLLRAGFEKSTVNPIWFDSREDIVMVDNCHTTAESASIIAKTYVDHISQLETK